MDPNDDMQFHDVRPTALRFYLGGTQECGRLEINDENRLVFSGDADKSARIFFDRVCSIYNDRMRDLEVKVKELTLARAEREDLRQWREEFDKYTFKEKYLNGDFPKEEEGD